MSSNALATRGRPKIYQRGDRVEVASTEEGFVGSYYEATVVSSVGQGDYIVEYATLDKEDSSGPLTEVAARAEIRPLPPPTNVAEFREHDLVDAFDNDGWWLGRITGRDGDNYSVFFDDYSTRDEFWYPSGRLRVHLDWVDRKGMWDHELPRRK